MEAEMNVDQDVSKDQGDQLKAQEKPSPLPLHDDWSTVSNVVADKKEEKSEVSPEELGSALEKSKTREEHSVIDQVALGAAPNAVSEDSTSLRTSPDNASDLPVVSIAPGDIPQTAPGKKRPKKSRLWKKNAAKEKLEKNSEDIQAFQSVDAETQTESHEPEWSLAETDLDRNSSSLVQQRASDSPATTALKITPEGSSRQQNHASETAHEEEHIVTEEKHATEPSSSKFELDPTLGRWADVIEDSDRRANDKKLEGHKVQELIRPDERRNRKDQEQELRGKSQQGRDAASPASRELDWRRKASDSPRRQETFRTAGKLGDTKKDEAQDFRARVQHDAEPQATHKNWVARRGIARTDNEGRGEQSKARGKGKQSRESGLQNQHTKDLARQKFEADLKVKQEELLQKSKLSLKAEFQKAKRLEQLRRGRDELEEELNKNLFYDDDGGLYFTVHPKT